MEETLLADPTPVNDEFAVHHRYLPGRPTKGPQRDPKPGFRRRSEGDNITRRRRRRCRGVGGCRDVSLAPCVEDVVDERSTLEQAVVVGFDVEAADPDRQQPEPGRVGVKVFVDVSGVHDPRQADQRWVVVELVAVDQHLETAPIPLMSERRASGVETVGTLHCGDREDVGSGDVDDFGVGVDEPTDKPRARNPVGLGAFTGNPLHGETFRSVGAVMPGSGQAARHGGGARTDHRRLLHRSR